MRRHMRRRTAGEHEHDTSVSSLSIIHPGDVDFETVQAWVGKVRRNRCYSTRL